MSDTFLRDYAYNGTDECSAETAGKLLEHAAEVSATAADKRKAGHYLKALHTKDGQRVLEIDLFWRKMMTDPRHDLSVSRQASL